MLTSAAIADKMDSKLILVVIGVVAAAFGCSEAVTCYSCSSERQRHLVLRSVQLQGS